MVSQKVSWIVTPAKAGVQDILKKLDSGFGRNEALCEISTPYESIKFQVVPEPIENLRPRIATSKMDRVGSLLPEYHECGRASPGRVQP